jgi:hypothetical protein
LLIYPDGGKEHISKDERDTLVLSNQAKRAESGNYLFTGQIHTFHSFSDLSRLQTTPPGQLRAYHPGYFIFEFKDKRAADYLESPEHMALRFS